MLYIYLFSECSKTSLVRRILGLSSYFVYFIFIGHFSLGYSQVSFPHFTLTNEKSHFVDCQCISQLRLTLPSGVTKFTAFVPLEQGKDCSDNLTARPFYWEVKWTSCNPHQIPSSHYLLQRKDNALLRKCHITVLCLTCRPLPHASPTPPLGKTQRLW